jgi:hypothetical protein
MTTINKDTGSKQGHALGYRYKKRPDIAVEAENKVRNNFMSYQFVQ